MPATAAAPRPPSIHTLAQHLLDDLDDETKAVAALRARFAKEPALRDRALDYAAEQLVYGAVRRERTAIAHSSSVRLVQKGHLAPDKAAAGLVAAVESSWMSYRLSDGTMLKDATREELLRDVAALRAQSEALHQRSRILEVIASALPPKKPVRLVLTSSQVDALVAKVT